MRRLALLALTLGSAPSFAWGPEGHRLVARLADDLLASETTARIQATLQPGETIVALASWADEVRKTRKETEPWHFIDIPIDSSGLDMKRDCPAAACVVGKIAEFRRSWRDGRLSPSDRREALLFLVHFVGDMHEPLHCSNHNDRGGNDVNVEFAGTRMSLHRLWDSALLDHMAGEDQLFITLQRAITPEERTTWAGGTLESWADESFRAAKDVVYGALPNTPQQMPQLGGAYERMADPVIERQLEKAAVRLAAVLNEMP